MSCHPCRPSERRPAPRARARAFASALMTAALLAGTVGVAAQPASAPAPSASPAAASLSSGDRRFLQRAAADGLAEVELSRVAQQQASDPQVKAFADRMLRDHGKANDDIMQLASARGVTVDSAPSSALRRQAERMGQRQGAAFDSDYMRRMVADHRKAVSEFQAAARSARDADVKAFADRTLPTLRDHLDMAQRTYEAVRRGPSRGASPGGAASPASPASR